MCRWKTPLHVRGSQHALLVTPTERANFLEAKAQWWTALSGRPLLVLLSSLFLYCFSFFFPTIQAAATGNQSFRDPQQVELSLPVSLSLRLPVDPHSSGTSKGSSGCCCVPSLQAPPGWFCCPSGNSLPSAAQTHLISVEVYGSWSSYDSCEELKACEVESVFGENVCTLRLENDSHCIGSHPRKITSSLVSVVSSRQQWDQILLRFFSCQPSNVTFLYSDLPIKLAIKCLNMNSSNLSNQ